MNYCFFSRADYSDQHEYQLKRIWLVDEDEKYFVKQQALQEDIYVAVRTLNGKGEILLKDKGYRLQEGSFFITNKRSILQYGTCKHNWHFYWFEFHAENMIDTQMKNNRFIQNELSIINDIIYSITSPDTKLALSGFNYLITKLLSDEINFISDNVALQAAQYIDLSPLNTNYSFAFLLKRFNISERTLRKKFFKSFSMTPNEYISRRKFETIKILLKTTSMKLCDIARITGFENEYYFSRCVKLKLGVPPSEYRKRHLNNTSP